MFKIKSLLQRITCIIMLITFITFTMNTVIFANDDDSLQVEEINILAEDAAINIEETPIINSRHAVIYDRSTRKGFIWKKGK